MKKNLSALVICMGFIGSILFVPSVSAQQGATIEITIHKIGKEDPIEEFGQGGADWSYAIWVYDGNDWQTTGWVNCQDDKDDVIVDDKYTFTVYTTVVSIYIALKERDPWGEELADISSAHGGGLDSFTGTYPGGARYRGTWDLKTNSLSGDTTYIEEGYYKTSGLYDGSETRDENDASLWFDIVDYYDPPIANAGYDKTVHAGEKVNFDASASTASVDIIRYQWDFESDGIWDMEGEKTSYTYNTAGTYEVTLMITDSLGETSIDTCKVYVKTTPKAAFVYSPNDYPHPTTLDTIQFIDTSTIVGGTLVSWNWDFGDGETSTDRNPTHRYSKGGTYLVTLTVTANDGETDTEQAYITVIELANITGYVKDEDGNPISGATIKLYKAGTSTVLKTTTTNTNGEYVLSGIEAGTYDIEASKSGYDNNKKTYKTIYSGENTVNFVLTISSSPSSNVSTPGFEMIFVFLATMAVSIILSRKRK